jgi:hypothetical protein
MQSLQVARIPHKPGEYSDLRVLRSAAGWYIGTIYQQDGSPGSRDSCYFKTEQDADFALAMLERMYATLLIMREQEKISATGVDLSDESFSQDFAGTLYMCGLDPQQVGYRLEP